MILQPFYEPRDPPEPDRREKRADQNKKRPFIPEHRSHLPHFRPVPRAEDHSAKATRGKPTANAVRQGKRGAPRACRPRTGSRKPPAFASGAPVGSSGDRYFS